jgi:beta-lactamase class A
MVAKETVRKITIARPLLMVLLAGALAIGVFIGAGMRIFSPLSAPRSEGLTEGSEGAFRFIRASVESKTSGGKRLNRELKPFQYKVNALIEERLHEHDAVAVSVYFRDLNDGNWFGIGERDRFSPKNLLKMPLMIAYFKWAETNPLVLRRSLVYAGTKERTEQEHSRIPKELEAGKSYTVNDLIYRMIVYDDAAAYTLLYANLPAGRLDKIFKDLYVEYDPHKQEDSMTLNAFAAFYRVLFNASYLNEEMSEKALRYLSKSTFRDGMAAGVPPNIDIASKHGERTIQVTEDGEEKELSQLHEFGIVYYPNRPYLLGVIARGDDFDQLVKIARDISRLVYKEVDQQQQP